MKFFYGDIILDIPLSVYCPEEDSLLLAKVLEQETLEGKTALDMGCGSGFLAVLMAQKGADVTACDSDEASVAATKRNAATNNTSIKAVLSDLFSHIDGTFDLIAFNPPYLPEGEDEHVVKDAVLLRQWQGGEQGRTSIELFIAQAKQHLNEGGRILMLISSATGEQEVGDLFKADGFTATIAARQKIPWEELMVIEAHNP
ncbi:MAG: methyltransferase [Candidatus Aenigmarchaeota archaeon]|nr:methyltransferase [Candidatus Aenigmarchaeota archaeon]